MLGAGNPTFEKLTGVNETGLFVDVDRHGVAQIGCQRHGARLWVPFGKIGAKRSRSPAAKPAPLMAVINQKRPQAKVTWLGKHLRVRVFVVNLEKANCVRAKEHPMEINAGFFAFKRHGDSAGKSHLFRGHRNMAHQGEIGPFEGAYA